MAPQRHQEGGNGLFAVLGIAVGLTAEAIGHRKEKKHRQASRPDATQYSTQAQLPPPCSTTISSPQDQSNAIKNSASDISYDTCSHYAAEEKNQEWPDLENPTMDEATCDPDDAARALNTTGATNVGVQQAQIPKGLAKDPAQISVLVDAFVTAYPPLALKDLEPLSCPVVIPQRRPKARDRGFVRAYAPMLADSGISEGEWLRFLDFYDESLKYSNAIKVVNVAAMATSMVPSVACMVAGTIVGMGAGLVGGLQSRQRSNDFISRMNEEWFIPMGMVCLVLKLDNDSGTAAFDLGQSISQANGLRHRNFSTAHGSTTEFEIPGTAPLVFPEVDKFAETSTQEGASMKTFKGRISRTSNFVADYMDRRARATFAVQNPNSQLGKSMMQATRFQSSLGDPTQMTAMIRGYNGTSLRNEHQRMNDRNVFGGRPALESFDQDERVEADRSIRSRFYGPTPFDHDENTYGRRESRGRDSLYYRRQPRDDRRQRTGGSGGLIGSIAKLRQKHVLYMMVVALPSETEITAASNEMSNVRMSYEYL